jgi:hypothetical protein
MRAEFFLTGMVERGDEDGERILLGDNTDSGAVMLQPIGLQYFGVRTTPRIVYIHMYNQFRLAQNVVFAGPSRT